MEESKVIEYLSEFGLTRQEAVIYQNLLKNGMQTGYEVAKQTGISRSNAYNALAGLVEKGAAYSCEGSATKYEAVEIEEFCTNKLRSLTKKKDYLATHLPKERQTDEGYLTIRGDEQILHKIKNMLLAAQKRVYLSMSDSQLEQFLPELTELSKNKIKIVLLTNNTRNIDWATVYQCEIAEHQIGVITDSGYVLTGELGNGADSTCLYSGQKNLVRIFKDYLKNEIQLIALTGGKSNE